MPGTVTPRQAALWFAAKGYPILPLHSVTEAGGCTCGNSDCESVGKHPFAPLAPHGLKDATVDIAIIRALVHRALLARLRHRHRRAARRST